MGRLLYKEDRRKIYYVNDTIEAENLIRRIRYTAPIGTIIILPEHERYSGDMYYGWNTVCNQNIIYRFT
jgi:hypothetical protein